MLSSFVNESNPMKRSVINRANGSPKELDKGRYAFGVAKQRCQSRSGRLGLLSRLRPHLTAIKQPPKSHSENGGASSPAGR